MPIPWIHGLKTRTDDAVDRFEWQYVAALTGPGNYAHVQPSERTEAAERGLGLCRSTYWFIGRVASARAGVVFTCACDGTCEPEHKGVTPFDSGGLWHGEMVFDRELPEPERRGVFDRHNWSLAGWQDRFLGFARTAFVEHDPPDGWWHAYVQGKKPTTVVVDEPFSTDQHPLAWTWEGHLCVESAGSLLNRGICFMSDEMYFQLRDWLDDPDQTISFENDSSLLTAAQDWARNRANFEFPPVFQTVVDRVERMLSEVQFDD